MKTSKKKDLILSITALSVCVLLIRTAGLFSVHDNFFTCSVNLILYFSAYLIPIAILKDCRYNPTKKSTSFLFYVIPPILIVVTVFVISLIFNGFNISDNMPKSAIQIVKSVLFTPVLEELLFRKKMCGVFSKYGVIVSIVVSSLFFCVIHGNFCSVCYSFLSGLILAYTYMKTGKILPCVFAHFFNNALFIILPYILGV